MTISVIDNRLMATTVRKEHREERQHGAHCTDDHQDHAYLVDVEAVLTGPTTTAKSNTAATAKAMMLATNPPAPTIGISLLSARRATA
jgi:hypothetical protein